MTSLRALKLDLGLLFVSKCIVANTEYAEMPFLSPFAAFISQNYIIPGLLQDHFCFFVTVSEETPKCRRMSRYH